MRREFSRAQKAQMLKRASDAQGNVWCEGCGLNITGKSVEFDHTIAEALVIDKTKPLTIDDGKALGRNCCHRAPGGKTAQDVAHHRQGEAAGGRASRHPSAVSAERPRFPPRAAPSPRHDAPIETPSRPEAPMIRTLAATAGFLWFMTSIYAALLFARVVLS